MAKGRKLTTSRSERLLGSHSLVSTATDSLELGEDEVWSMVDSMAGRESVVDNNSGGGWGALSTIEHRSGFSKKSSRRIPKEGSDVGGLGVAIEDRCRGTSPRILHQVRGHPGQAAPGGQKMARSAPVKVPEWRKIQVVESEKDSEIVPPHEYLVRSQKMGETSVFEGVGRTLKGRDMSRVRDAVWMQTGFDG